MYGMLASVQCATDMIAETVELCCASRYLEFAVTVRATRAVGLSDIVLRVQAVNDTAKMMCGFGVDGYIISLNALNKFIKNEN